MFQYPYSTEQLRVEEADEDHWNYVAPNENAGNEHPSIRVVSEGVEWARCQETLWKNAVYINNVDIISIDELDVAWLRFLFLLMW